MKVSTINRKRCSQLKTKGVAWELFPTELLNEVRSKFAYIDEDPFNGKRIFFENAGGSLRLKSVVDAVADETAYPDAHSRPNPAAGHLHELYEKGYAATRIFLNAKDGVVFVNQTASRAAFSINGAIIENVPGTNVVTTAAEHPSNFDSVTYYAQKANKEVRMAECDPVDGGVKAEEILKHVDRNTAMLAFMYASNITGAVLEVQKIIDEARRIKPDLYIVVDITQQVAHGPIDIDSMNIDGAFFAPYKMFGKRGVGIGWVSERASRLNHERILDKPITAWDIGSIEPVCIGCMVPVIDYICWIGQHYTDAKSQREQIVAGMTAIELQERGLLERALNGTKETPGLRAIDGGEALFIHDDFSTRDSIIPLSVKNVSPTDVSRKLKERGIITFERVDNNVMSKRTLNSLQCPGLVRVSPNHYNSPEEIDAFLRAVKEIAEGR